MQEEGGAAGQKVAELQKKVVELERQGGGDVGKLQQENKTLQGEMERLLQLMQMSEEEKFAKDNQIKQLQESVFSLFFPIDRNSFHHVDYFEYSLQGLEKGAVGSISGKKQIHHGKLCIAVPT